jgi:hypothetical protein
MKCQECNTELNEGCFWINGEPYCIECYVKKQGEEQ